ncbi:uncharacterized protein LOC144331673 [Macaca mulatta]
MDCPTPGSPNTPRKTCPGAQGPQHRHTPKHTCPKHAHTQGTTPGHTCQCTCANTPPASHACTPQRSQGSSRGASPCRPHPPGTHSPSPATLRVPAPVSPCTPAQRDRPRRQPPPLPAAFGSRAPSRAQRLRNWLRASGVADANSKHRSAAVPARPLLRPSRHRAPDQYAPRTDKPRRSPDPGLPPPSGWTVSSHRYAAVRRLFQDVFSALRPLRRFSALTSTSASGLCSRAQPQAQLHQRPLSTGRETEGFRPVQGAGTGPLQPHFIRTALQAANVPSFSNCAASNP